MWHGYRDLLAAISRRSRRRLRCHDPRTDPFRCGDGAGKNSVFAIAPAKQPGDKPKVEYSFKAATSWPYVPTLVTAGNLVFLWADRGFVACIDAPTGKVHYQQQRVGGDYFSSPVRIGDRIFGISSKGQVVVIAASPEFKVLARNELGDETHATPAVANGRLYLRTQTRLMSLGGS